MQTVSINKFYHFITKRSSIFSSAKIFSENYGNFNKYML